MLTNRSLYAQVMGEDFDRLDPEVRRLHCLRGHFVMEGHCAIEGPTSRIARWFARIVRLPTERTDARFSFEIDANEHREIWIRHFPGRTMRSTIRVRHGVLVERLGPTTFRFGLRVNDGALEMQLRRFSVFGIPCPRRLAPRIQARETGRDGRFHFDVAADLPLLGRVTRYTGHLVLPTRGLLDETLPAD